MPDSPYKPKTYLEYRENMVNYLVARASRLSNFNPGSRAGSIIEAVALELAKADLETFNGFTSAILEGVYNSFGFSRLPGAKAVGTLRLEHSGHLATVNYPVFQVDLFGLRFETLSTAQILVGQTFTTVSVRAVEAGSSGNLTVGAIDTSDGRGTISPAIEAGTRVWNNSSLTGGTDEESDSDRLIRFQQFINSLGRSTPEGIKTGALSVAGVTGVVVQSNINPYTQLMEVGWVNVFVSDGTASPPPALLTEVLKTIEGDPLNPTLYPGYAAAGTRVFVGPVTITAVNVTYELTVVEGSSLTDDEAKVIVEAAAIDYVNSLPVGQDVLYETLLARMLTSHPDFYDVTLLAPTADVSIPQISLPRIGGTSGGTISGTLLPRVVPT